MFTRHAVLLGCTLVLSANAFVPRTNLRVEKQRISTRRSLTPDLLPDVANNLNDWMNHLPPVMETTSHFLADAAATTDAASAQVPTGWWGDYINIFKTVLTTIHSTIDQPLRNIGVEQTWGFSIMIFTFLCRSLLVPLSIQQSKSTEYMKRLQPYITEISEKFKDNEQAKNRAIGKLYEDAEQNPLSGCLTSLAQLPIFLGVYRGVRVLAVEDKLREPFFFIPSLVGPVSPPKYSGMDWLTQGWTTPIDGGLPVPPLGWETTLGFLIMPVVLVLLQSVTMKVLQPPVDDKNMSEEEKKSLESSQLLFKFLPLLIGFFSLQVPAALTIYWLTSNLFTLSQSLAVRAYFAANPPKIELPEYWDRALSKSADFESMTPDERRQAVQAGIRIGPSFEDLMDEARFHSFIERRPFREGTEAWNRVVTMTEQDDLVNLVPGEMQEWVAMVPSSKPSSSSKASQAASPAAAVESGTA